MAQVGGYSKSGRPQVLADHVRELRNRLFASIGMLLVAGGVAYWLRDYIVPIILRPYAEAFGDQKLVYLNPSGGFTFIFLVILYVALALAAPFIIYQIFAFVRPVLPHASKGYATILVLSSILLLASGVTFGYVVAIPGALDFLSSFASDYVDAALTAESYLNFVAAYTVGLGLLFQIPLILIIWNTAHPISIQTLGKSEQWVIALTVIAAAIVTPTPDPQNLMMVAIPIVAIYQIGVVVVLTSIYRRRRAARRTKSEPSTVARHAELYPPNSIQQTSAEARTIGSPKTTRNTMDGDRSIVKQEPRSRRGQIRTPKRLYDTPVVKRSAQSSHQQRSIDGFVVRRPH